jgi:hypothetical protein
MKNCREFFKIKIDQNQNGMWAKPIGTPHFSSFSGLYCLSVSRYCCTKPHSLGET